MSAKRPESEGVVLRSVAEIVEAAEEKNEPWPELDEPRFTSTNVHSRLARQVTVWTMAGLLGAITVYAIATGDQRVLLVVVAFAAGTLVRLTGLKPRRRTPRKRAYDPRSKRRKQKRIKPR